ncbi:MAG: glycoside hydrolase family 20 protein [Bacteroidia bacterium]
MKPLFLRILLLISLSIVLYSCDTESNQNATPAVINLVPRPANMTLGNGAFIIQKNTKIYSAQDAPELAQMADLLANMISQATGFTVETDNLSGNETPDRGIIFRMDQAITNPEGYTLSVTKDHILISAQTPQGAFYGFQTLRQLFPPEIENPNGALSLSIPVVEIADSPRYPYRGLFLDVSRHMFSVQTIKKYIDLMALHKYNVFHWHLTDDQGWRIEIKKYPKLTEVGAWRKETLIGHGARPPFQYDGERYGGYYTQDQIREVVAYAKARYITVIPEIEMPGHAMAALAAYPELGCTSGPFEVATRWGVMEDVFCPTETTFAFLEDVLREVIELFPSEYIHIGGDECPKTRWENSAFCQNLMKQEGLKDEHELQSYFIRRIEKFLLTQNRKIIGWDEILEGGLAPEATVMSWRGTEGGIEAARQKHDVIMTPTQFCYLDYYQGDPAVDPLAIGGNLTLEKVYSFEPTPSGLSQEEENYIRGAQANVWTEYIKTQEHLEFMVFPRACAMAEVVWSPKASRDWEDFAARLAGHLKRLGVMGVNYAPHFFDVSAKPQVDLENHTLSIALSAGNPEYEIRYSMDGRAPDANSTLYASPIKLEKTTKFAAATFANGQAVGRPLNKAYFIHLATAHPVTLTYPYSDKYTAGGASGLVNGITGSEQFSDGNWQGFEGKDLEAVVDLGEKKKVSQVITNFFHASGSWIFEPTRVEVSLSSDGSDYQLLGEMRFPDAAKESESNGKKTARISGTPQEARYVKVKAVSLGVCPQWHPAAGQSCWLFVDEIVVE